MDLKGIVVPLITPFRSDGTIDDPAVETLIEHVVQGGVSGIFVLGSCGEFPALTTEEKVHFVQVVKKALGGRIPLLAGIGETTTKRAIELGQRLAEAGANCLVASSPLYYIHSQDDLYRHFALIATHSTVPILLYNIPQFAKNVLTPPLVRRLLEHDNIIGLKDSAGDMTAFQEYLELKRQHPKFVVFQGAEPLAALSLVRGADGAVLGLANVAPRLCSQLYLAAIQMRIPDLWDLQRDLMTLYAIYNHRSWLAGLKTAVSELGLCRPVLSVPFTPLSDNEVAAVRQAMWAAGLESPAKSRVESPASELGSRRVLPCPGKER